MAQNVKKVASENLKKPKVAENSKSCQNSKIKKLPKISKVAEKLPSNLWLSLAKGRELELEISLLAIANLKNILKIAMWAEEFCHGGVDLNPLSTVRGPQSAVRSLHLLDIMPTLCFLHNVVGEPLTESLKEQKYRVPSSKT